MYFNYYYKYLKYKKKYNDLKIIGGTIYELGRINSCSNELRNLCLVDQTSPGELQNIFSTVDGFVKGFIFDDNRFINNNEELGRGTYGTVTKLTNLNQDEQLFFVLKDFSSETKNKNISLYDYFEEKRLSFIIQQIKQNYDDLKIIDAYWYEKNGHNYIIMKGYDDNLFNMIKNIEYNAFTIFKEIFQSYKILTIAGLYYCDIKPGNILYKQNDDGTIDTTIADIGSIITLIDNDYSVFILNNDFFGYTFHFSISGYNNIYKMKIYSNNIADEEVYAEYYVQISSFDSNILNKKLVLMEYHNDNNELIFHDNETDIDYVIPNNIKLYIYGTISTYPHYINNTGYIEINQNNIVEIKKILVNNILFSLGVLLIFLVTKTKKVQLYSFNKNKYNFINNKLEVNTMIDGLELLPDIKKNKLKILLFGNDDVTGLLNIYYIDIRDDDIEDIFDQYLLLIDELIN